MANITRLLCKAALLTALAVCVRAYGAPTAASNGLLTIQDSHLTWSPLKQLSLSGRPTNVDNEIDGSITGHDRHLLQEGLSALPAADRTNVMLITLDGTQIMNRRAAQSAVRNYTIINSSTGEATDGRGDFTIVPPQEPKPGSVSIPNSMQQLIKSFNGAHATGVTIPEAPEIGANALSLQRGYPDSGLAARIEQVQKDAPFDLKSGPFYGVRAVNGFTYQEATVSPPCGGSSGRFFSAAASDGTPRDRESGYIYLGGWGSGGTGKPVDAGLQRNSQQNIRVDDYALVMKYYGQNVKSVDPRFICGHPIHMELFPIRNNLLVLVANGPIGVDAFRRPVYETLTMIHEALPSDGWTLAGTSTYNGMILKRITSIAQPGCWFNPPLCEPRPTDPRHDGSFFGTADQPILWVDYRLGTIDQTSGKVTSEAWFNSPATYEGMPMVWIVGQQTHASSSARGQAITISLR